MKVKQFFIRIFNRIKSNIGWKSAIFLGVFAVLLAADLLTKHFEEAYSWNFTVIPGFIEVESGIRNPGAGFSWLADKSWGQPFLIALTVVMVVAVAEQQGNRPYGSEADQDIDDTADQGGLAAKQPCNNIELENTDRTPVQATDND